MKNLEKLVGLKSDGNCNEILKFLKRELTDKVKEIEILGDDTKILIAGLNCNLNDIEPIVLSGHIDTVGANMQLYKTNPFELTKIGDKAFGLGSIDMKSFTAVVLDRIEEIKNLTVPVILALTTDEETKLGSIELMIKTFKDKNIKPKFTILGEPTKSEFNLCSNACYEYSAEFFGKACHSSKINEGINAICACAKLVSFIEERQKCYELTSNCGVIKGGEVVNKVPDYAELRFDIRSIEAKDIESFVKDINDYMSALQKQYNGLSANLKQVLAIPAFNMFKNDKIQNMAKDLDIKTAAFSGGCEAGYYTAYAGDAIIFGVGDLSLAHKPNEYVVIDEYYKYSAKLLSVLQYVEKAYFVK